MIRRIVGEIPFWMRADYPMLRYRLEKRSTDTMTARYTRALLLVLMAGAFLLVGYAAASDFFTENPFDLPFSQLLIEILFWPTVILQVGLQIAVLLMTINTIREEQRRQTWDNLRATTDGAALTMRTRWSAVVFYRMRGGIGVLLLVRVVLITGLLFDLTAFQGEYLASLTGSIVPDVPLLVAVLLVALTMTASLLLPITGIGLDAAFGLLVSTFVRQRTYVILVEIVLVVLRIAFVVTLVFLVEQFRVDVLDTSNLLTWMLLLAFGVFGDWGLRFLYLGFFGEQVWGQIPYGILLGAAMMGAVVLQAVLTDAILALAIRRAERSE